ncbi:Flavinator of succinate dehydrogenase-domain-containing protein [Xylogone sp. PMI_703]|nr:Flavinator of succinate dehydrogenase-domain-containing protein [Xylogone sp. PMI_703]
MAATRLGIRSTRSLRAFTRPFSTTPYRLNGSESANGELEVGELQGAKFKIEPLRRVGEDPDTMRARLLYQSRKRGTLESDLLMSTFADAYLRKMTPEQLDQYDRFLDENDWDIYYWATQEPPAKDSEEGTATPQNNGENEAWSSGKPKSGEWAQTIGTFKPAYRPVPERWRNSEILALLRRHVKSRSAGGVVDGESGEVSSEAGGGMAFMPKLFDSSKP